jgi:hypothetical protein
MTSEIALRFKQIPLKSKYKDPFKRLGADATSQTDIMYIYIYIYIHTHTHTHTWPFLYFKEKCLKP